MAVLPFDASTVQLAPLRIALISGDQAARDSVLVDAGGDSTFLAGTILGAFENGTLDTSIVDLGA